jgi:hypothetical protein
MHCPRYFSHCNAYQCITGQSSPYSNLIPQLPFAKHRSQSTTYASYFPFPTACLLASFLPLFLVALNGYRTNFSARVPITDISTIPLNFPSCCFHSLSEHNPSRIHKNHLHSPISNTRKGQKNSFKSISRAGCVKRKEKRIVRYIRESQNFCYWIRSARLAKFLIIGRQG